MEKDSSLDDSTTTFGGVYTTSGDNKLFGVLNYECNRVLYPYNSTETNARHWIISVNDIFWKKLFIKIR